MFKKLLLTSALLATFATAHAQSSQNFGVTGTVTPGACNVTLTSGVANLGTITQATAKGYTVRTGGTNTVYVPPLQLIPINISCGAATKVEVSFVDNKPGKNFALDGGDLIRFGMVDGAAGTSAVGSYEMSFITTTIDSVAVGTFLHAANGATTWNKTIVAGVGNGYIAPGYTTGFAKVAAATVPESITTVAGTLQMQIFLSKTLVDGLTTTFSPNGSGTLTLVYL